MTISRIAFRDIAPGDVLVFPDGSRAVVTGAQVKPGALCAAPGGKTTAALQISFEDRATIIVSLSQECDVVLAQGHTPDACRETYIATPKVGSLH
jgi:hypothetical protein